MASGGPAQRSPEWPRGGGEPSRAGLALPRTPYGPCRRSGCTAAAGPLDCSPSYRAPTRQEKESAQAAPPGPAARTRKRWAEPMCSSQDKGPPWASRRCLQNGGSAPTWSCGCMEGCCPRWEPHQVGAAGEGPPWPQTSGRPRHESQQRTRWRGSTAMPGSSLQLCHPRRTPRLHPALRVWPGRGWLQGWGTGAVWPKVQVGTRSAS